MRQRNILAIDPGLRALGVAVLDRRGRLRHAGVLAVPPELPLRARLRRLGTAIDELIRLYRPAHVLLEATWPSRNRSLALVHRVAKLYGRRARARGIRVVSVPSSTVRRRLLGNGRAGKRDVAVFLAARYPELRVYLHQGQATKERHFQNLFDALALGLYGLGAK